MIVFQLQRVLRHRHDLHESACTRCGGEPRFIVPLGCVFDRSHGNAGGTWLM